MTIHVAAVLTCHNRRAHTLACLDSLTAQTPPGVEVTPVVCDDGSTDGTATAIHERVRGAVVVPGDGTLFWNGGMRRALARATRDDPDHYLWLNDDTVLDDGALGRLLRTHAEVSDDTPAIVVGTTRDPTSGALTYGGVVRHDIRRPMRFSLVEPRDVPIRCETMNGNIVLVPRDVMLRVGNLDPAFVHAMGDYDYGLRAQQQGCRVWVAPGTAGVCARNEVPDPRTIGQAWRRETGRKGLPPDEWREFTRRWAGPKWPVWFVSPYLRRLARAGLRQLRP